MQARKPIVAGQFYPGQHGSCLDEVRQCLEQDLVDEQLPAPIVSGIVPHAGWTFSGRLAAMVFSAIKRRHEKVDTFVIFGAAHGYFGPQPAVYDTGCWKTPLGDVDIDEELADAVLSASPAVSDPQTHASEHSIEVQLPFIQHLFVDAKVLPIIVPPTGRAVELGTSVGDIISHSERKVVCIGSTDLTHYGPRYGFTPMGAGVQATKWASEVNDRHFIDLALKLDAQAMLANAAENCSACGAGAAAAAVAAAKKLGKTTGVLLAHTNSNDVMSREIGAPSADTVGYAAIVF